MHGHVTVASAPSSLVNSVKFKNRKKQSQNLGIKVGLSVMDVVSEVVSAKQDGKVHLAQIGKKRSSIRVSNSLLLYKMTSRSTQCHSCEEEKVKNDGNPLY